jgi:putative FmdB family regulatory protein
MPTYEYVCKACNHAFEEFQSITAEPTQICPKCGKKKVQRLIGGGAGIVFKGSGFYITDHRSESYKKAASSDSGSAGSSSSKPKPSAA